MGEKSNDKPSRDWGLFFGGILVFLSGLVVLFWPGLTLIVIAEIAGVLLLVGGIVDFIAYARQRKTQTASGWTIVNGICNVILGLMFLLHPIVTASVIPLLAGAFVVAYGVMAIIAAFSLRNAGTGWGLMLLNGIVSILCGFMFVFMPETFAIFLGIFMMMRGITMSTFGLIAPSSARVL